MPTNPVIVVLDIHNNEPGFEEWNKKSGKEKIDLIADRIKKVCDFLSKKNADSNSPSDWIIAWREYAITDTDGSYLKNEDKKYFKEIMTGITKIYPKLVIVGGTTLSERSYDLQNNREVLSQKVEKITNYYKTPEVKRVMHKELEEIAKKESRSTTENVLQVGFFSKELQEKSPGNVQIVRNTTYCFADGRLMGVHDKVASAYAERLDFSIDAKRIIMQPGSKKEGGFGYYKHKDLTFGVEICREHRFEVFKDACIRNEVDKPAFHFLLSHYVGVPNPDAMYGQYFVHIDSEEPTQIISCDDKPKFPVSLYKVNMLTETFKMGDPILPRSIEQLTKQHQGTSLFAPQTTSHKPNPFANYSNFVANTDNSLNYEEIKKKLDEKGQNRTMITTTGGVKGTYVLFVNSKYGAMQFFIDDSIKEFDDFKEFTKKAGREYNIDINIDDVKLIESQKLKKA